MLRPGARELFEQRVPEDAVAQASYGHEEDEELKDAKEAAKEMMVVATRGSGVDFKSKASPELLPDDIRGKNRDSTWAHINLAYFEMMRLSNPMARYKKVQVIHDSYRDPEAYNWN
ncbi:hypothetical protein HJFPF1_05463 [Paramyrothecium foliicola]|nr:hypothetical protein HJFPF1_05463 [Paramyrothecium foliicola]